MPESINFCLESSVGAGTSVGWKLLTHAQMQTIWFVSPIIERGEVPFRMLKFFILLMGHSTCIRTDAICLPFFTSSAGNCFWPSRKGGMFKSTPILCSMSLIMSPWSAILDILPLPSSFCIKPDTRVSSTSEIEHTVVRCSRLLHSVCMVSKNFAVLWCL